MGVRIIIRGGRVQEVGYRLFLLKEAERLGIKRFQAENIEDYVEVLADAPKEKLEKFIDYVKTKRPTYAQVESIKVEEFKDSIMEIEAYYRLLQTEQLYKIAETGLKMLGNQKQLLAGQEKLIEGQRKLLAGQEKLIGGQEKLIEGQRKLIEGQRKLIEGQRKLIEGQRKLLAGQEKLRWEIKGLREDLKAMVMERISKIESDVAKIKAKLGID